MSIYVFWLIVFFSAFVSIVSGYLISFIESLIVPDKKIDKDKKTKARRRLMSHDREDKEKEELVSEAAG